MAIYQCKVSINGNKNFFREYQIEENSTLYEFHRFIQTDLDFDDAQLAVFFISDKKWEKIKTIPLFDFGNGSMDSVSIADLIEKNEKYLLYVFDMYHDRKLQIEFTSEVEKMHRASYPQAVLSKGNPPGQFSKDAEVTDIDIDGAEDTFDSEDFADLSEKTDV